VRIKSSSRFGSSASVGDDVETVADAVLVMTVRERKIAYVKGYQSKAEALEAVGLSEQGAHAEESSSPSGS
jgi:hypothetical protein